ncbi:phage shock protein A [Pseudomonas nitritireducens]|uniref:Phage shock protein A n=1 Tax=Pseudomonas nitroreducens TaxID=46680 RepID=A0A7W7KPY1_PSENT|nr:PspA/IM30 family protein [Pseudomonas nitritireducens]MBB4866817.1 phage shock protein A [Pseudomonas nitritireducens]
MSAFKDIIKAIQNRFNGKMEETADGLSTDTAEQYLREARANQDKARLAVIDLNAKVKLKRKELDDLNTQVESMENKCRQAQEKGLTDLAMEAAGEIGNLRQQRDLVATDLKQFETFRDQQQTIFTKSEGDIKKVTSQLDRTRARKAIQESRASISASTGSSGKGLNSAMGALQRAEDTLNQKDAQLEAAEELDGQLSGKSLEDKFQAAGIGQNENYDAKAILESLSKK